jgi:hypothetical protein
MERGAREVSEWGFRVLLNHLCLGSILVVKIIDLTKLEISLLILTRSLIILVIFQ